MTATIAATEARVPLPLMAARIGRSTDAVKRLLRTCPHLEPECRVWRGGPRLFTEAEIAAVKSAFEERDQSR